MRIGILKRLVAAAMVGQLLLLVGVTLASLHVQQQTVAAAERARRLSMLAAEMRESSNELTGLARDYIATGRPEFRERYFDVLRIRAGQRPRPRAYSVSNWRASDRPREGQRKPLLALLRAEGVSSSTFSLLARSLAESESLARLEIDLMAQTAQLIRHGDDDLRHRASLIAQLHSDEYHASKRLIMDAANRFEEAVRSQAATELSALQEKQRRWLLLGLSIVAFMLAAIVPLALYVRRAVLRPLCALSKAAERMSKADYSARASVAARNELGRLAQVFNAMASSIASDFAERERLQRELELLAKTDALTGLANRRSFMEAAQAELARVKRYGRSAAVLMLDIDFFKTVNDCHGHAAGDGVLIRLGQILRAHVREVDIVGRLGGEEFALVLPEIDGDGALRVAQRLRGEVEKAAIPNGAGPQIRCTISVGIAMMTPTASDLETLLERADAALYDAKRAGRNRVEAWDHADAQLALSSILEVRPSQPQL